MTKNLKIFNYIFVTISDTERKYATKKNPLNFLSINVSQKYFLRILDVFTFE